MTGYKIWKSKTLKGAVTCCCIVSSTKYWIVQTNEQSENGLGVNLLYWHKFYIRRKLCTLVIVGPYVMFCNMIKRPPWHFISIVQQSCSFRHHWSGHYNLNELSSTFHFFCSTIFISNLISERQRIFCQFYLVKNITHKHVTAIC